MSLDRRATSQQATRDKQGQGPAGPPIDQLVTVGDVPCIPSQSITHSEFACIVCCRTRIPHILVNVYVNQARTHTRAQLQLQYCISSSTLAALSHHMHTSRRPALYSTALPCPACSYCCHVLHICTTCGLGSSEDSDKWLGVARCTMEIDAHRFDASSTPIGLLQIFLPPPPCLSKSIPSIAPSGRSGGLDHSDGECTATRQAKAYRIDPR